MSDTAQHLPRRMWINQPSASQPLCCMHGTRVLAVRETETVYRIYFLWGPMVSQQAPALCLSDGWPE